MLNYLYQYRGIRIYYAESIELLVDNINEINPHIFAAVPRVIEKIYDKIYTKGLDLTGVKRKMFFCMIRFFLWKTIKFQISNKKNIYNETL